MARVLGREAGETAGALPDASRPSREAAKPAGSVFSLLRQQRRLWSLAARGGRSAFARASYR